MTQYVACAFPLEKNTIRCSYRYGELDQMKDSIVLSEKLKTLRKAYGYSQETVGNYISISRQGYQHYESGKREPDINRLYKLSLLYDIPLFDLVSEEVAIKPEDLIGESPVYTHAGAKRERQLIAKYRKLSEDKKKQVIKYVDMLMRTI